MVKRPYCIYNFISAAKPFLTYVLMVLFAVVMVGPMPSFAQGVILPQMPKPGIRVSVSPDFKPVSLYGIRVNPENSLLFDFIVDKGDMLLTDEQMSQESTKLIKYFLAALTIPESDLWVNLSPYEKERIVPESLGVTQMGRDLLAQDYLLKQISASLMYPEEQLGKQFWQEIYQKAKSKFDTVDVKVNTFNKVWILPDQADIYEEGNKAMIINTKLRVMLEEDYLALAKNAGNAHSQRMNQGPNEGVNKIGSDMVRKLILPALEHEINQGKNFAVVRQIYHALILATWFKNRMKESILGKVYVNRNKVAGVDIEDKQEKEKIYQQYLQSFKKGVYNYIKEEVDPNSGELIPRKYFSGGALLVNVSAAMRSLDLNELPLGDANINFAMVTAKVGTEKEDGIDELLKKYEAESRNSIARQNAGKSKLQINVEGQIHDIRNAFIVLKTSVEISRQIIKDTSNEELNDESEIFFNNLLTFYDQYDVLEDEVITEVIDNSPQALEIFNEFIRKQMLEVEKILKENSIDRLINLVKMEIEKEKIIDDKTQQLDKLDKLSARLQIIRKRLTKLQDDLLMGILKRQGDEYISEYLQTELLNLKGTIKELASMADQRIEKVMVELNIDETLFVSNKTVLSRLINNLIRNSLNIFEERQVSNPKISVYSEVKEDGSVEIIISDNAGGAEKSVLDNIGLVGNTTRANKGGSGLGLYNVVNDVETLGGKVTFKNIINSDGTKGFQVTIILPGNSNGDVNENLAMVTATIDQNTKDRVIIEELRQKIQTAFHDLNNNLVIFDAWQMIIDLIGLQADDPLLEDVKSFNDSVTFFKSGFAENKDKFEKILKNSNVDIEKTIEAFNLMLDAQKETVQHSSNSLKQDQLIEKLKNKLNDQLNNVQTINVNPRALMQTFRDDYSLLDKLTKVGVITRININLFSFTPDIIKRKNEIEALFENKSEDFANFWKHIQREIEKNKRKSISQDTVRNLEAFEVKLDNLSKQVESRKLKQEANRIVPLTLKQRKFDLKTAIEGLSSLLDNRVKQKGITIKKLIEDVSVFADYEVLQRALDNAVKNAINQIEENNIEEPSITFYADETKDDKIRIIITDNAGGAEKIDAIGKYGVTTREDRGGSGKGLKSIIDDIWLLGGEVVFSNVFNNQGERDGFQVTIILPKEPKQKEAGSETVESLSSETNALASPAMSTQDARVNRQGGINLDPQFMDLNVSGYVSNQMLRQLTPEQVQIMIQRIEGFTPTIMKITPVNNWRSSLGFKN